SAPTFGGHGRPGASACSQSSMSRCVDVKRLAAPPDIQLPRCLMSKASTPASSALRSAAANLAALCISLAMALLLGEILVRAAFRGSMDFDMEMWKYATQIKVPSDDPRVVHEHRPSGRAFLMGVEVTTNSFGLREGERTQA